MTLGQQLHTVPSPTTPFSKSTSQSSAADHHCGERTICNGRKRARPTSRGSHTVTPTVGITREWSACQVDSASDAAGHLPFFNTKYNLLEGIDTPTLELDVQHDGWSGHNEANFRRRWSVSSARKEDSTAYPRPGLQLRGERNGQKLLEPSPNGCTFTTPSWSRLVCGIFGGVAGKMWDFCKASAFRGFHAGGGKGYESQLPARDSNGTRYLSKWEDMDTSTFQIPSDREASPMPGMWPELDYFGCQAESPHPRPAKRNRTAAGSGWVVVGSADSPDCTVSTPGVATRKLPGPGVQQQRAAARTQLRKPAQSESRRSTLGTSSQGSPAVVGHHRRSSKGPLRTPSGRNLATPPKPMQGESPMSAEARRYAERMRREERQADASILRLNDRLSAMIREGKKALGTKVEVVDDMEEDEGFFQ